MEGDVSPLIQQLSEFWAMIDMQARLLLRPSRLWQVAIIIACFALAWVANRMTRESVRNWMREREGLRMWQFRLMLILHRRATLILFVLFTWTASAIMAELYSFPSRRFLITLVATIATAILLVGLAARTVRNVILRRIITWGLWAWVTVYYLGILDEVSNVLDSIAFDSGELHISLLTVLRAAVVIGLLVFVARFVTKTASDRIRSNDEISPSMQVLAVKLMQLVLFTLAVVFGLKAVGVDLTGLAFLSGAIGLGLGFGLQKVVSNLVSGIIILLDKSIKPGDVISLGDTFGWINALGARYVSVVTRDGREYLIPNEDLITGQVVNWSHSNEFVRLDIHFGTSYDNDPHQVRKLAVEAAANTARVVGSRPPVCHITGFGDSSVDYILRFWITDPTAGLTNIRGNVLLALWDTFKEHDIAIPFPQREVRVLNDRLEVASRDA